VGFASFVHQQPVEFPAEVAFVVAAVVSWAAEDDVAAAALLVVGGAVVARGALVAAKVHVSVLEGGVVAVFAGAWERLEMGAVELGRRTSVERRRQVEQLERQRWHFFLPQQQ